MTHLDQGHGADHAYIIGTPAVEQGHGATHGYVTASRKCPCGTGVMRDGDEWVHLDGSISHDGEFYDKSVSELMKSAARQEPNRRIFGPTQGLDHRLFDGDHLKPDVREYILGTLGRFWDPVFGPGWRKWARVYFAGSEASEWTSETLEGNNDFDVLIGVDYDEIRRQASTFDRIESSDEQITDALNRSLRKLDEQTAHAMIVIDGKPEGPFDNTWYVNHDSWDIRKIRPYAAYNVTDDGWAVKPPHLPDWDLSKFPEGKALRLEVHAVEAYVRAVLALPEPYRSQQGAALWDHLHGDRSRAFGPQGEGWYDPANVIEKWLDQLGLWEKLVEVKMRTRADPSLLNAPTNWSNNPS